jgi:3'-phosphoadenosine 5'-phosphosulfate sulfotransferase (PAPS reductase)/FAD synthetase
VRLAIKTGTQVHAEWFRSWSEEPYWRDPLPGTIITRERAWQVRARLGYDGAVFGTRMGESPGRRVGLRRWGILHERPEQGWHVHPLAHWEIADVWAAIAAWELPYNPVYDVMAKIGVPRERQRVGPLPLSEGWVLRDGWPELWRRLNARYGRRWGG